MEIPQLSNLLEQPLPQRLKDRIEAVLGEDDAYAADELVELAEEILQQLAAAGFAGYMRSSSQRDSINDFLLQLFISSGHDYNAGPLFRWAANAIRNDEGFYQDPLRQFFWREDRLQERTQHLSELRNRVMHGFFVLPPEVNRHEAARMGELLSEMIAAGLFRQRGEFHFHSGGAFTGHWNVSAPDQWQQLMHDSPFGMLCRQVVDENSDEFWHRQQAALNAGDHTKCPDSVKKFIADNSRGAMALWIHPADPKAPELYAAIGHWLIRQPDILTMGYVVSETGLSFTDTFLLRRLAALLPHDGKPTAKGRKPEDLVAERRKKEQRKVVVLVGQVHLALFSRQHLTNLADFFYRNNIILIATGHHLEHLDKAFNKAEHMSSMSCVPDEDAQREALRNYLRFKGPFADRPDDGSQVAQLHQILYHLCSQLKSGEEVVARRFADKNGLSAEQVHEVFGVLHPWVKNKREPFEDDTLDELYGIPSVVTEVTPVYLALGRRDVRLEYQHKILFL